MSNFQIWISLLLRLSLVSEKNKSKECFIDTESTSIQSTATMREEAYKKCGCVGGCVCVGEG